MRAISKGRWPWPLLWATGLWAAFAIWEWLILVRTPEANIRIVRQNWGSLVVLNSVKLQP